MYFKIHTFLFLILLNFLNYYDIFNIEYNDNLIKVVVKIMENNNEKFNQELFDILNTRPKMEKQKYVIDRHKSKKFKQAKFSLNKKTIGKLMALTFGTVVVFSNILSHEKEDKVVPVIQSEVTVTTFTSSPNYEEKVEPIRNNNELNIEEIAPESEKEENMRLISLFEVGNNDYINYVNKYIEEDKDEYEYFEKYSKMYGIPTKIMIAIGMQESSLNHRECLPGGKYYNGNAIGILQLEQNCNNSVTAYNYETNELETAQYNDSELCDIEKNIQVSCMLFQNAIEKYHGNIYLAIQSHNYGQIMLDKALEITAEKKSSTVDEIIDNYQDISWLDTVEDIHNNPHKYLSNWSYDTYGGGKNYLYNILSYCLDENVSYKYNNKNTFVIKI